MLSDYRVICRVSFLLPQNKTLPNTGQFAQKSSREEREGARKAVALHLDGGTALLPILMLPLLMNFKIKGADDTESRRRAAF